MSTVIFPEVKIYRTSYEWVLENPDSDGEEGYRKVVFFNGPNNKTRWSLNFVARGFPCADDRVAVFVYLDKTVDDENILAGFTITIKGCRNAVDLTKEIPLRYFRAHNRYSYKYPVQSEYGWNDFEKQCIILDESHGYLVNGKLIIQCQLSIIVNNISFYSNELNVARRLLQAFDKQKQVLESGLYADIILECNDGFEVRAHKALLASQSLVFNRMFQSDMAEAKTDRVKVVDLTSDAMTELTRFTRSGNVQNLNTLAMELLYAAEKYEMTELFELCVDYLSQASSITSDNVYSLLILSDLLTVKSLKLRAINFVKQLCYDSNKVHNRTDSFDLTKSTTDNDNYNCNCHTHKPPGIYSFALDNEIRNRELSEVLLYPAINVSEHSYEWVLENPDGSGRYESSLFDGPNGKTKWRLVFYSKEANTQELHPEYFSIFLKFDIWPNAPFDSARIGIFAGCRVTIKGSQDSIDSIDLTKEQTMRPFFPNSMHEGFKNLIDPWCYTAGWHKFGKRSTVLNEKGGYLIDGKLTIKCQLSVVTDDILLDLPEKRSMDRLLRAFANQGRFLEQGEYADTVIICRDGVTVSAHKALLASQSPVFNRIFQSDAMKAESGRVVIDDGISEAMIELVRFTRSGRVHDLDGIAVELLKSACKYEIEECVEMCVQHFSQPSSINAENFCVLLMLADLYHITTLKNSAIGFFKRFAKYNEPMKLNEWKKLLDYPDLMAELFSA